MVWKYRIRKIRNSDVPELVRLARAYWSFEKIPGFSPKRYQHLIWKILKNPSLGRIWVATQENRVIGYLVVVFLMSLEYGGLSSEIDELYVDRLARGRAAGKSLLKAAGKSLSKMGVAQVSLRVGKANRRAIRFYKNQGFRSLNGFFVMDRKARKT